MHMQQNTLETLQTEHIFINLGTVVRNSAERFHLHPDIARPLYAADPGNTNMHAHKCIHGARTAIRGTVIET